VLQAVSSLAAQRTLFTDITTKLGAVGAKFPVVNSLVTAIRRKKSKVPCARCRCCTHCDALTLARIPDVAPRPLRTRSSCPPLLRAARYFCSSTGAPSELEGDGG
jgi:hypothetical protein